MATADGVSIAAASRLSDDASQFQVETIVMRAIGAGPWDEHAIAIEHEQIRGSRRRCSMGRPGRPPKRSWRSLTPRHSCPSRASAAAAVMATYADATLGSDLGTAVFDGSTWRHVVQIPNEEDWSDCRRGARGRCKPPNTAPVPRAVAGRVIGAECAAHLVLEVLPCLTK